MGDFGFWIDDGPREDAVGFQSANLNWRSFSTASKALRTSLNGLSFAEFGHRDLTHFCDYLAPPRGKKHRSLRVFAHVSDRDDKMFKEGSENNENRGQLDDKKGNRGNSVAAIFSSSLILRLNALEEYKRRAFFRTDKNYSLGLNSPVILIAEEMLSLLFCR